MTLKKTTPKDSRKKILLAGLLAAALTMATLGPAHAALLSQAGQLVNLMGVSDASGTIPFTAFKITQPDGSTPTWTFPASGVLVVTEFSFTFRASGTPLPPDQVVRVTIGPYEGFNGSTPNMTAGMATSSKTLPTGFVIGPQAWTAGNVVKVSALNDPNNTPIPGYLTFRVLGFIYPAPTGGAQAGILESGGQLLNLVGTSDAGGTVPFNTINVVQADGSIVPWSYPGSGVLVVTSFSFAFIASPVPADQTVFLNVGTTPSYGFNGYTSNMTGGKTQGNKVFPTGFVIGPQAWTTGNIIKVFKTSDATATAIPGSLIIHLNGYLAPP